MGLALRNRLKDRKDFQTIYQQGIRHKSSHLTLRGLPDKENMRIGITVSRKVSKKAVIRNRIKRWIRAIFRELLPYMSPGWKIIIVVHPGASQCQYEHFLRELKELLIEARIINGH